MRYVSRRTKPHFSAPCYIAIAMLLAGCGTRETPVERGNREQILHLGNGTEPQDIDPHIVTGVPEHNIIAALFEGLVSEDPRDLSPVPGAAERWTVSDNGLVYTFYLQKNGKWSNGDPVTARDFIFSYQRILSPGLAGEYAYMLFVMKNAKAFHEGKIDDFSQVGVDAIDDGILRITLNSPTPYFLSLLNHYSWFPVHPPTILKHGKIDARGSGWTRPESFVGNGPFTLDTWKMNQMITVRKSETYWDRDTVRLNEMRFYPIENADTEERFFRSGQLHVCYTLPLSKIDVYEKTYPDLLKINPFLGTYFYRVNVTRPPLDNPKVRRALSMAIDRKSIVENVTKGGQLPAHSFTPPGTAGYTAQAHIPDDIDQARSLLDEAGYPDGQGFPPVEILYNTLEAHRTIAQAIQQMWKKSLNIDVKLLNQEWKVYLDTQKELDYDICRAGWIGDYVDPNTFLDMFLTGGGNNDTGWSNAEYDRLIAEAARMGGSPAQRHELFQRAEEILLAESPIIPIYTYTRVYAVRPEVRGWYPTILDHHPYKHLYLEAAP